MPSTLTQEIYDGTDLSFRSFALRCARNIDYAYYVTDGGTKRLPYKNPPITTPETEYKELYEAVEDNLLKFLQWRKNPADAEEEYNKEKTLRMKANADSVERNQKRRELRKRYEDMKAVVEGWCPGKEYGALKASMLQSLDWSIANDCYETELPYKAEMLPIEEWIDINIELLEKDVVRYREKYAEECKRVEEMNAWVSGLYERLDKYEEEKKCVSEE